MEAELKPRGPRRVSRNQALIAGSLGLIVILVAAAVALPLAGTHPGDESSPSPSEQAWVSISPTGSPTPRPTVNPFETPTASPTPEPTPEPTPSPKPPVVNGWPVTWEDPYSIGPAVGPDGVIHMRLYADASWIEVAQVDSSGHQAKTWQPLPAEGDCIPVTPGVSRPCFAGGDYTSSDGTRYQIAHSQDYPYLGPIEVRDAHGNLLSGGSTAVWESLTMGPDGTVVAWRRVIGGWGEKAKITQTKLAVIGKNGRPVAGWPLTFQGAVSPPTIGSDGTIYVTLAAYGTRSARVLAIGLNGKALVGWPYLLPAGRSPRLDGTGAPGDPFYPVAPILGRNGSVYVAADEDSINGSSFQIKNESIFSIDRNGQLRPGWPAALPGPISVMQIDPCIDWCGPYFLKPLLAVTSSGSALLYVHVPGRILALDDTGSVVPGWPKEIASPDVDQPPFYGWLWWAVLPDGDLAAVEVLAPDEQPTQCRLWRWNPDGSLSS
jgi:hypothetical protein